MIKVTRKLGNKSIYAVATKELMKMIHSINCFTLFGNLFLSKLSLLYCLDAFLTRRFERKATKNGTAADTSRMAVIRNAYWISVSTVTGGEVADDKSDLVSV